MRHVIVSVLLPLLVIGQWTNSNVSSVVSDTRYIENNTDRMQTYMEASFYDPMQFRPSIVSDEYQDNINLNRGNGKSWYDSWLLTDDNAKYYINNETNLRIGFMKDSFGDNWSQSYVQQAPHDIIDDSTGWNALTSSNFVGKQNSALGITENKVSDSVMRDSSADAFALVNSFQATVQTYLNYQYNNENLFEIDLEPIGILFERFKEMTPNYVVPSAPFNVFQGKKFEFCLVPKEGTVLKTIHNSLVNVREIITYMMWGYLVFTIFETIVSFGDK